jgi:hypothetical protein
LTRADSTKYTTEEERLDRNSFWTVFENRFIHAGSRSPFQNASSIVIGPGAEASWTTTWPVCCEADTEVVTPVVPDISAVPQGRSKAKKVLSLATCSEDEVSQISSLDDSLSCDVRERSLNLQLIHKAATLTAAKDAMMDSSFIIAFKNHCDVSVNSEVEAL